MTTIAYTITDELGLHARPAGKIVKMFQGFAGKVEIAAKGKTADGKRVMAVMKLSLKQGDAFTLAFDGEGEEAFVEEVLAYLKEVL